MSLTSQDDIRRGLEFLWLKDTYIRKVLFTRERCENRIEVNLVFLSKSIRWQLLLLLVPDSMDSLQQYRTMLAECALYKLIRM